MSSQIFGNVFDIQHFSISDGPGIRTTVFLKGCPLRCEWCHNPESLSSKIQIMYHKHKCICCGLCVEVCPENCHKITDNKHFFDSTDCIGCNKCIDVCNFSAVEAVGKMMSAEDVISCVDEDIAFYESSQGGMTLSGGEPMYQPDFSIALAKLAKKRNLHVCLETSGFCSQEKLLEIFPYVDMFLFDYKASEKFHKELTGADNALILNNLYMLDSHGAKIVLRCPIVPERNMNDEHIDGIISVAKKLTNLLEINLEPYHNIGIGKKQALGMFEKNEAITPPGKEIMQSFAKKIEHAVNVKTIVM